MGDAHSELFSEQLESRQKEIKEKWEQVRINAAISALSSIIETTKHSVIEETVAKDVYARVAVAYADSLVKELQK